jgi:hypothetical protein
MSPTLAQHFRSSQCDPPHERFAVGVPLAFATSCFRQGHRRYAPRTWRRETHRDCWRTRGTSARLRLPIQLTEESFSIILHSSPAGNQKPCFKTLGGERKPGRANRMDSDGSWTVTASLRQGLYRRDRGIKPRVLLWQDFHNRFRTCPSSSGDGQKPTVKSACI